MLIFEHVDGVIDSSPLSPYQMKGGEGVAVQRMLPSFGSPLDSTTLSDIKSHRPKEK